MTTHEDPHKTAARWDLYAERARNVAEVHLTGRANRKEIFRAADALAEVADVVDRLADERDKARVQLDKVRERVDDPLGWSHGLRRRADLLAILDESASRPAPTEASECRVCHRTDGTHKMSCRPQNRIDAERFVAAPAPIEAGEREALAEQIVEGHRQATEQGVTSLKERIAFMADTILAAGFRRAPIEDAEPEPHEALRWTLRPSRGGGYELAWSDEKFRTRGWWLSADQAEVIAAGFRLLAPGDAEPVAYEVRDKATGAYIGIFPVADAEDRRTRIVYPLYRHPAAPIEVTDEAVRAGALAMYKLSSELSMSGASDLARATLTAAFKEMGKSNG